MILINKSTCIISINLHVDVLSRNCEMSRSKFQKIFILKYYQNMLYLKFNVGKLNFRHPRIEHFYI